MGIKVNTKKKFSIRSCTVCGEVGNESSFLPTNSPFFPDSHLPICDTCLDNYLKESEYSWDRIDEICRYINIPFIPKEWTNVQNENSSYPFNVYCKKYQSSYYDNGIDWKYYNDRYLELKNVGGLDSELPLLDDFRRKTLAMRWGANYDDEALNYLENLYQNTLATQNISSAIQDDNLLKICKLNYEIDCRIRAGQDVDKLIKSCDTLIKSTELTPKNSKNINDFDTIGELIKWFDKRGYRFRYYDNVTRDVVDETMKNIQNFNRKLYTNEVGIGEEINRRIDRLTSITKLENAAASRDEDYYETKQEFDMDKYDNDGYENLKKLIGDEEFDPGLNGEEGYEQGS